MKARDLTGEEWRQRLTPQQYAVLRLKGTEAPFTGKYVNHHGRGMYLCAACGKPLFRSQTKFDSGTDWPSFYEVATRGNVELQDDNSNGMKRLEVTCGQCGSHLGHLFADGPARHGGRRYCINSCALDFQPKK